MTTQKTVISQKQVAKIEREICRALKALKGDIQDDHRASEDDTCPGMCVTFSTKDFETWSYQTGDNSYTGSCYGDPHWAVVYLYRRSNCTQLASDAVGELADSVCGNGDFEIV